MRTKVILGLAGLATAMYMANKQFNQLDFDKVESLTQKVIRENGFDVDYRMIVIMAKIESDFNKMAFRFEAHLNDGSVGLMQTLLKTAKWLAEDMGYTKYGVPTYSDLLDAEKSIYFGCAYVEWLSTWKGVHRTERWIVESYNGGPNNTNSMTQNHYRKYLKAKEELY
tara:strand:+ start:41 stop:544 length:504 start_codon:yes stop_codon:yes gene_type:complete